MLSERCKSGATTLSCCMANAVRLGHIDDEDVDRALTELENMEVGLRMLKETRVIEQVSELCRCEYTVHTTRANALLNTWTLLSSDSGPTEYQRPDGYDYSAISDSYDYTDLEVRWRIHRKSTGKMACLEPENLYEEQFQPASIWLPQIFEKNWTTDPVDRRTIAERTLHRYDGAYHRHVFMNAEGNHVSSMHEWDPHFEILGRMDKTAGVLYLAECVLSFRLNDADGMVSGAALPAGWHWQRATSDGHFVAEAITYGLDWV